MRLVTLSRKKTITTETTANHHINQIEQIEAELPLSNDTMKITSQSPTDACNLTTHVFNAKNTTKIGTWNVRTLYQSGRLNQVLKEMLHYKIDILGLCEMRWTGSGKLNSNGISVIYSGHPQYHFLGVGICMNKPSERALIGWKPINERIITARFQTKHAKVTIIQVHAPTNESDESVKNDFYDLLQETLDEVPSHDMKILSGDFNAQIDGFRTGMESTVGPHGIASRTNDNGERFLDFCNLNNISIGNTFFKHKRIHKYTWLSPDKTTKTEIDFIGINTRWRSSVQDIRIFRGADCGSDHNLVVGKIRPKFKRLRKVEKQKMFDINKLKDAEMRQQYSIEVSNRFASLPDTENIEERWESFKSAVHDAAKATIGYRRGTRKEQWISQETWSLIDERKETKLKRDSERDVQKSKRLADEYNTLNKAVKNNCRRDKKNWYEKKCQEAESAAVRKDSRSMYKIVRDLTGARTNNTVPIKDKAGKVLLTLEEQLTRWVEHFNEVLNQPIPTSLFDFSNDIEEAEELELPLNEFSEEEIQNCLQELPNNKASGHDHIQAELLKNGGDDMVKELKVLANIVWNTNKVPDEWKLGEITILPKKGNLADCNNWRGITLLCITRKLISRLLLKRIQSHVDSKLREEQAGFRSGRSYNEQIFSLRNIIEQSLELQSPIVINYVDFKKAFDSIHRPSLWKILRIYGISQKYINLFAEMYENSRCCVKTTTGTSEYFAVDTGVQQGGIPSPFFFLIVIDYVLTKSMDNPEFGISWNDSKLTDLDFADDLALISNNTTCMQQMTDALKVTSGKVGLRISKEKTKLQLIGLHPDRTDVTLENESLDITEKFTYLGSIQSHVGDIEVEVRSRIGKAASVFKKLQRIWISTNISTKVKLRLYSSLVLSITLYACETWKETTNVSRMLDVFHLRCLRKLLKISWREKITNATVLQLANSTYLSHQVRARRLQFFGHVARLQPRRPAKVALNWSPQNGKRARGRPKKTWRSSVVTNLRSGGTNWYQAQRTAQDRLKWRKTVAHCCTAAGGTR